MATPKQAHALVTYFGKKYTEKVGATPVFNRYSARWGFDSMLMDMSADTCMKVIDYYFETSGGNGVYALDWFLYNYDKLVVAMRERDKDAAAQALLREQSKRRTEEWRKKVGNNGSESS